MTSYVFDGSGVLTSYIVDDNIGSATEITITGYTSIGDNAFYNRSNLTTVTIGNSVTHIDSGSFGQCSNLTTVIFTPISQLTHIGVGAFNKCTSLTTITIPESVTTIHQGAFGGCTSLTTINIPNLITHIQSSMFALSSKLLSITIPSSVTSIGSAAFDGCSGLTTVIFSPTSQLTSIGHGAFNLCVNLQSITIPESVTTIHQGAFGGCSKILSITIPSLVTSIGDYAFSSCFNLLIVQINNQSVFDTIGNFVFAGIPTNSRVIFYNTSSFSDLTINKGRKIVNNFNNTTYYTSSPETLISPNLSSQLANGDPETSTNVLNYIQTDSSGQLLYVSSDSSIADVSNNVLYFKNTGTTNIRVLQNEFGGYTIGNTSFQVTVNASLPIISPTIIMGNKRVFKGDSITVNPISNNSTGTFTYQSNNGKVSIQGNIIRGLEIGTATITVTQQASGNYTTGTATFQVEVFYYYCFKEGTSILTEDGYVKVEELTQTHKVKTLNGYKKVYGLRKNEIEHKGLEERIADQLYVCRKEEYPELTEELVMTGRHGILENVFKDEKQIEDVKKVMGKLSSTGAKVRVPVCVDERSKVYEVQGKHSIYHVAVENDNRKINEGIYANGLLVESCSISEL